MVIEELDFDMTKKTIGHNHPLFLQGPFFETNNTVWDCFRKKECPYMKNNLTSQWKHSNSVTCGNDLCEFRLCNYCFDFFIKDTDYRDDKLGEEMMAYYLHENLASNALFCHWLDKNGRQNIMKYDLKWWKPIKFV